MFEQFVKERVYLKNVSKRTIDFYWDCFRSFERYGGELTKAGLNNYVVNMRKAGVKPVSCNTYISANMKTDNNPNYDRPEDHDCTMNLKGYCNGCTAVAEALQH